MKTPSGKAQFEFYFIDGEKVVIKTEGGSYIKISSRCFENAPIFLRGKVAGIITKADLLNMLL